MIKTLSVYDFINEFKNYGRENQFTREGSTVLFDYLEENHYDDQPYELDVISLCCEFTEYNSIEDFKNDYDYEDVETIEDIEDYTTVIKVNDESFIISNF